MSKSRDAFRTISEVSDILDTPAHVLRFWESKFTQVKPVKRAGGRRYYRPTDVDLLSGIKQLLHDDGMTIKGAQKLLREKGVKHVAAIGAAQLNTPEVNPTPAPEVVSSPSEAEAAPQDVPVPPVEDAPSEPAGDVGITNVVSLPPAPAGPKLSINLASKPEPASSLIHNIPKDPSDSDSKATARLFHLLHKAPQDKLALQATAIAPLLDRMQVLRDRIETR